MAHTFSKNPGFHGVLTSQEVKARRNLRDMGFLYTAVLVSFVLIGVLFIFIWCRLTVVSTGYEISRANAQRNVLLEKNRRLRVEFMKLKSPERIERIATRELGLVHPTGRQIIRVR
ncbi:MAG: hypothetical protein BMS9Abin23_0678 [Thermodesulfobacteriota bacterium]|nr:MAG: hypothetical protein BMS9Abin23_0678 [Thermodesulfobacteriota bacterium]